MLSNVRKHILTDEPSRSEVKTDATDVCPPQPESLRSSWGAWPPLRALKAPKRRLFQEVSSRRRWYLQQKVVPGKLISDSAQSSDCRSRRSRKTWSLKERRVTSSHLHPSDGVSAPHSSGTHPDRNGSLIMSCRNLFLLPADRFSLFKLLFFSNKWLWVLFLHPASQLASKNHL